MTIKEIKDRALKLMDDYSMRGTICNDADIKLKMNTFIDMGQKELARYVPIEKTYTIPYEEGVTEYEMPEDFRALKCTWIGDEQTNVGKWRAGKLLCDREVTVEYFAYPATITDSTPDTDELEISPEAQELLPYWVAAQNFITDVQVDYRTILNIYDRMLAALLKPRGKVVRL